MSATREQIVAATVQHLARRPPKELATLTVEDDGDLRIAIVSGDHERGVPAADWVAAVTGPDAGPVSDEATE